MIDETELKNLLTLRYDPRGASRIPKKSWKDFDEREDPFDVCVSRTREILRNELGRCLDKGKQIGLGLSGGIDTTAILLTLRELDPKLPIRTLTIAFGKDDPAIERSRHLARKYGTEHEELVITEPLAKLPQLIWIHGKPRWHLYSYFLVEGLRRNDCDLIILGGGGDELFGGYVYRYKTFVERGPREPLEKTKTYLETCARDWVPDQESVFGKNIKFDWSDIHGLLLPYFGVPLETLSQVFLADYNGKMIHEFDPIFESWKKHFGADICCPLLCDDMVNYATHVPIRYKYDHSGNRGKLVLREIIKEEPMLDDPKRGFGGAPSYFWTHGGQRYCEEYLANSPRICRDGLINTSWIGKTIAELRLETKSREAQIYKMLGLLALEVWYRLFVTREMDEGTML